MTLVVTQAGSGAGGGGVPDIGCGLRVAGYSIANNITTTIPGPYTEDYDNGGCYDAGINASSIVIPAGAAGRWLAGAHCSWGASHIGFRRVRILKNGSTIDSNQQDGPSGYTSGIVKSITAIIDCAVGDVLEVAVFQTSGVSLANSMKFRAQLLNQ